MKINILLCAIFLYFFQIAYTESSSYSINFDQLPYSRNFDDFTNISELTEDDFKMYLKIPELIESIEGKNIEQASEYAWERYAYELNRITYIGIKITYIYSIIYESQINDTEAFDLCFKAMHESIKPNNTEMDLVKKYRQAIRLTKNKIAKLI